MPHKATDAPDLPGFAGFDTVTSPAVVLNGAAVSANIARMQALASGRIALHPHIKTHKSVALARRQIAAGAAGVTAARAPEARPFIAAGIPTVTIAYPIIDAPTAADLLALAACQGVELRFVVDSTAGVMALAAASSLSGIGARAFIEIDVGLNRCGVDPAGEGALHLAALMRSERIELVGVLSHAGQSYGASGPDEIAEIAARERRILLDVDERLRAAGVSPTQISVGSTPTALANAGFDGLTELRPGNYIFLDLTAVRLGIARRRELALAVAATVISANDRYAIVDAGSKTLSSDMGPHGTGAGAGYGEAWLADGQGPFRVEKLSEEHGFLDTAGRRVEIGTRVLILPNHSCPVVNLAQTLHELDAGSVTPISVDA